MLPLPPGTFVYYIFAGMIYLSLYSIPGYVENHNPDPENPPLEETREISPDDSNQILRCQTWHSGGYSDKTTTECTAIR